MKTPIICFEGPSGVGKTTLAQMLSGDFNIIPEVNQLFERSENEHEYWYYERQLERYTIAKNANKPTIFDGDIFQPIWYNWVCNYPANFLGNKETHAWYKAKIEQGLIKFPNLYIIFDTNEKDLRTRKENDTTRTRRNFEKHLKIIAPLRRYYKFLEKETTLQMRFIQYDDFDSTKQQVLDAIKKLEIKSIDDQMVFSKIDNWINQSTPDIGLS
ncbi:MAG: chloramphenicol acetyltransferase [Bacteroidota bacterium]